MINNNKIQALLIGHLQRYGALKLLLPDGIVLEIGTNQVGMGGELINTENYCWIIASKEDRMAVLDSYNLGLRFSEDSKSVVYEEVVVNNEGEKVRRLDVV
jgi:hypothetical protein